MPIVSVPRNGPPEAMSCPVMLCDGCGDRIHQGGTEFEAPDRARRPGMAVTWSRYVGHDTDGPAHTRLESSPMFFIHKGQCDRAFRAYGEQFYPLEDGWTQLWDDIEGVMQQLAHNMTHPFEDDPELWKEIKSQGDGMIIAIGH